MDNKEYVCSVCGWIFDPQVEGMSFEEALGDFVCPLCGVGKDEFEEV